jgi:hypothetical protein
VSQEFEVGFSIGIGNVEECFLEKKKPYNLVEVLIACRDILEHTLLHIAQALSTTFAC